ncbi:putative F-box/FBD/LRR-repeat protein At4g03220 [Lolium perenne]|uniref:putative F-box/FBD/LRR-repeat protein At4g03220 n=1 Tax=Lolium perenne TaxID=4522 RepID=UPI0021F6726D|nr:uncharacterized protein LOC127316438 isoform X1 [Lolium perenne]
MERSDDEAKRPKRADVGAEADHFSALPDDLIISILVKLRDAAAACKTSVLARRWLGLWAQLPELHFLHADPDDIRDALNAYRGPELLLLSVVAEDASPESVSAWLPIAARRVTGALRFQNSPSPQRGDDYDDDDLALPCFGTAVEILLHLQVFRLALPANGVFARLTKLYLFGLRLRGPPCGLGDAVSSPRSPCLKFLSVIEVWVLDVLTIHSESLEYLLLEELPELQHLVVKAPALRELAVHNCLDNALTSTELVAGISAPGLESLMWPNLCNPGSVQLGAMPHLRELAIASFQVYGQDNTPAMMNRRLMAVLRRFQSLESLTLSLTYPPDIRTYRFLMGEMGSLPDITFLALHVTSCQHSFGASLSHVLRMCTSIRVLHLYFDAKPEWHKEETVCLSDCICDEPQKWKTEELVLDGLEEVEIFDFGGTEHEVAVVKPLFCWATVLKRMKVNLLYSVTESRGGELRNLFLSFCRPEILLEFRRRGRLF